MTETNWTKEQPTATGVYPFRCSDTDYEERPIRVFFREDELWVNDPDVGHYPLETYCYNLTDPQWRL